jgi:L-ascorbate metabolism protein UlaG (beta-lactamase superfamily)
MADPIERCSLQFIGTATMLLRLGGFTVLTDPNFLHRGQRAYLGYGLTSKRRTEPALHPHNLPPLDAIVLSHIHGDHWDRVARHNLPRTLPVFTTPRAARSLVRQGFRAAEGMPTWTSVRPEHGDQRLTITSLPGRHAVGFARHLLPPVMGSLLEFDPGPDRPKLRMYISGDTLFVDDLREIPRRYPEPDVAALHLGGTKLPGGLLVTMDASQGADLLELIDAGTTVPIHNDDYGVFTSPVSAFRAELQRRQLPHRVAYVERGQQIDLPRR